VSGRQTPCRIWRPTPYGYEQQVDGCFVHRVRQDKNVEVAGEAINDFIDLFVNRCSAFDDVGEPLQRMFPQIREWQLIKCLAGKIGSQPRHQLGPVEADAETFWGGNDVDQRQMAEDVPHLDWIDAISRRHRMIAAFVIPVLVKTAQQRIANQ